ncbi:MAG TPA: ABC transporter permease [Ktedonobacterales bacterium]
MSALVTTRPDAVAAPTAETRPSFAGLVRGELFKISRQRATWALGIVLLLIVLAPYGILIAIPNPNLKAQIAVAPLAFLYTLMGSGLLVFRVFVGTFLIITTARLIGMEYSGGTIRVLLGRGVGRLELLGAKLLALAILATGLLLGGLLIDLVFNTLALRVIAGNFDAFQALNSGFWQDTLASIGTVVISMAVTILMAAAVTALTRSLAVGLAIGVGFFAADNIGTIFFFLASRLTNSTFWLLATGDLLGPNLNAMPAAVLPARSAATAGLPGAMPPPLTPVTGGHTLLVTAIWAAAFLAAMVLMTWKHDVTE